MDRFAIQAVNARVVPPQGRSAQSLGKGWKAVPWGPSVAGWANRSNWGSRPGQERLQRLEAFYGRKVNSLALLADAGHNLSDVIGLVLAWGGALIITATILVLNIAARLLTSRSSARQ